MSAWMRLSFTAVHDSKMCIQACWNLGLHPPPSPFTPPFLFCSNQTSVLSSGQLLILMHTSVQLGAREKLGLTSANQTLPTLSQNSSWYLVAVDLRMYWCLCRFLGWLPIGGEGKTCVHSSGILWISAGLLGPWPPPPTHRHRGPMPPAVLRPP